ncbi:MAG: hypothetical protein ACREBU_03835 [Nitrososphaera sp.]
MALKGRSRVVGIKHAKTQYLAIPAELVADSQYPLSQGEEVDIVIIPEVRKIEIIGTGTFMTKSSDPVEKKIKSTEAARKAWETIRSRKRAKRT